MKLFKEIEVDDGLIWVNVRMNLQTLLPNLKIEHRCSNCDGYGCKSGNCNNGVSSEIFVKDDIHKLKNSLSPEAIKKIRVSIKEFVDLFGNDQ